MSLFGSIFSAIGLPAVVANWLGVAGTLTPCSGDAPTANIPLQIDRDPPMQMALANAKISESQMGRIAIPSTFPKPAKGDSFTIGSEVWRVENAPILANGQFYCTVSRSGVERLMPRRADK